MVLLWKVLLSKLVACVGRILKAPSNEFRFDAKTSGTIDMQDGLGSEMVAKLAKATFASSCFGEYIEGRVACVETLLTWLHASLPLNLLKLKVFFFPAFMHFNAASVASLVLILCNVFHNKPRSSVLGCASNTPAGWLFGSMFRGTEPTDPSGRAVRQRCDWDTDLSDPWHETVWESS